MLGLGDAMLYMMNIGELKAGFARAAKDPEMIAMAEEGIEKFEISDVDINEWRRKLMQRCRECAEEFTCLEKNHAR